MSVVLLDGYDHYPVDVTVGGTGITAKMAAKLWQRSNTGIGGLAVGIDTITGRVNGNAFRYRVTTGGLAGQAHVFKAFPAALTTLTTGIAIRCSDISGSPIPFYVRTAGGTDIAQIWVQSDGSVAISHTAEGTILAQSAPGLFIASAWNYAELSLFINGASGTCALQLNGGVVIPTTTANFGSSAAGRIEMVAFRENGRMPNGTTLDFDDVYVVDDNAPNTGFLGDVHVETIWPNAEGTDLDFTPNSGLIHYDRVNEIFPDDDVTYNYDSTPGDRDSYNYPNLSAVNGEVKAVQLNQYCRKENAGLRQVNPLVIHAGMAYVGATQTAVTSYLDLTTRYDTNPGTSLAWTISDVNNAEFGTEIA